ncbi:hypothetical protein [Actinomadura nitritigenes]
MLGHLGLQIGLQHRLADPGQQPVRPDQRHPFGPGLLDQLGRELHIQPARRLVLIVVGHV